MLVACLIGVNPFADEDSVVKDRNVEILVGCVGSPLQ